MYQESDAVKTEGETPIAVQRSSDVVAWHSAGSPGADLIEATTSRGGL